MKQALFAAAFALSTAVTVPFGGSAAVASAPAKASLGVQSVRTDATGAVTKTCIRFDEKLAPRPPLPLRSYIDLAPERDYSAYSHDNSLCLKGLPYSQTTRVTIRKDLPSVNGHTLAKDFVRDVTIGARPKSLAFNKSTYILPRQGTPMLPITTVNYDRLDLKFYRVDERNFISVLSNNGALQDSLRLWQANAEGAEVWSGEVEIATQPDKAITTRIPIADMVSEFKPGLYALVAAPKGEMQGYGERTAQWVVVTDLGLSVYQGEKGFSVQVRSLKTAKPQDDVKLRLVAANNMVLAEGESDDDGWLNLPGSLLQGKDGKRPLYLTAEDEDGDFSFISLRTPALDLSGHGVAGGNPPGPLQTYLYSDRGIYRPGETVHLGYLLRDDAAEAVAPIPLTLRLLQPDGKLAAKKVQTPDALGGGRVELPIPAAGATGTWKVKVYADPEGDTIGTYPLEVSEFVPNRLEVTATSVDPVITADTPAAITVQADYLFGAPGADLQVQGQATLRVDRKPFPDLKAYTFGIAEEVKDRRRAVLDGKSNAKGHTVLPLLPFNDVDFASPLRLDVNVDVLDTDGRPNKAHVSVPYRALDAFVGLKPGFKDQVIGYGETATFDAIVVDADGKPLPNHALTVEWIHEERDYNWYRRDGRWQSSYTKYDQVLASDQLTTDDKGHITLSRQFDDWGYYRAVVISDRAGAAADYGFRVGWSADTQAPDAPDALDLQVESADIAARGTIEGFIKAPFAGRVALTIAHKSVLWRKNLYVPKSGRKFSIRVSKKWGSGAYLLATAYRPGTQKDQRGPGRAVGAKWLSFGKAPRVLQTDLTLPAFIRPDSTLEVPVQVHGAVVGKQPIKVNVFAVDEGILRLTGFKTPKPDQVLLAQQRLQLDYRDIYGRIIPPQDGAQGKLRSGGDAMGGGARNASGLTTRSFKTVALASQTADVGKDGTATVTFDVPDYTGKLRVFAVAYGKTAAGSGAAAVQVKSPVNAELLPSRFLAPGDVADFAFRFQNLDGPEGTYTVALDVAEASQERLQVANMLWKVDSVPGDTHSHRFSVMAKEPGRVDMTVRIEGPDGYARTRAYAMEVRPGRPWTSTYIPMDLKAGAKAAITADVLADYMSGTGQVSLSLSDLPDIDVQRAITALDRYPYGCLEQTISRAFPLLSFRTAAQAWQGLKYNADTLDERIAAGIDKVLAKQRSDGSFGLWSSHSYVEPWLTAYAMDFLTEARAKGYDVLPERFDNALEWMKSAVRRGDWSGDARAYMLMVLVRNNAFSTSQFKYQHERLSKTTLRALGRAQLSAAMVYQGLTPKPLSAKRLFQNANSREGMYKTYGSFLRDTAAVLTLPAQIFATPEDRMLILRAVSAIARKETWFSTQEDGWLLRAAAVVAQNSGDGLSAEIDGVPVKRRHTYRRVWSDSVYGGPVRVANTGTGDVFAGYTVSGIPNTPLPPVQRGLSIHRKYMTPDGKPVDVTKVRSGDRFWVVLSGALKRGGDHRALIVDMLPAGFEMDGRPTQEDLAAIQGKSYRLSSTSFRAERDDRFVAAVDLSSYYDHFTVAYSVRAVTPGQFQHPAPFVEDMYLPSLHARGAEATLTVAPAP